MTPPHQVPLEQDRVPAIDGMRGLAILLLLLGHWGRNQPGTAFAGWESMAGHGVVLLLVLTGYIATISLMRDLESGNANSAPTWLRRKALVTYPTLIAALLAATAIQRWKNGIPVPIERYPGFLSLFGNYYYALAQSDQFRHTLGHLWTLMVGAQFLIPWVLIMRWAHRANRVDALLPGLIALFTVSSGIRWMYSATDLFGPAYTYLATEGRVADIAVGALAGLMAWRRRTDGSSRITSFWAAIGSIVLIALSLVIPHPGLTPLRLLAMAHLVMWLSARNRSGPWRILDARPLTLVSLVSYSAFTWHLYGLDSERLVTGLPWLVRLPFSLTVTLGVAAVAYATLERPVRRWVVKPSIGAYNQRPNPPLTPMAFVDLRPRGTRRITRRT